VRWLPCAGHRHNTEINGAEPGEGSPKPPYDSHRAISDRQAHITAILFAFWAFLGRCSLPALDEGEHAMQNVILLSVK
jgi:hypothetical protein